MTQLRELRKSTETYFDIYDEEKRTATIGSLALSLSFSLRLVNRGLETFIVQGPLARVHGEIMT